MSLINDALKKAQNLKAAGATSTVHLAQPVAEKAQAKAPDASPALITASPPVATILAPPAAPATHATPAFPAARTSVASTPAPVPTARAAAPETAPRVTTAPTPLHRAPTAQATIQSPRPRPAAQQAQRNSLVLAVASGLFLTALFVFGVALYLAFGRSPSTTVVEATSPQASGTAVPTPESQAAAEAAPTSMPVPAAPETTAATATEPPAEIDASSRTADVSGAVASPAASAPMPAAAPPPPPPPPKRINRLDPVVLAWVEKIQITGVRRSDRPKVLMNDRVYMLGETVHVDFGLKLVAVGERTLTFEDPLGNTYDLRF